VSDSDASKHFAYTAGRVLAVLARTADDHYTTVRHHPERTPRSEAAARAHVAEEARLIELVMQAGAEAGVPADAFDDLREALRLLQETRERLP